MLVYGSRASGQSGNSPVVYRTASFTAGRAARACRRSPVLGRPIWLGLGRQDLPPCLDQGRASAAAAAAPLGVKPSEAESPRGSQGENPPKNLLNPHEGAIADAAEGPDHPLGGDSPDLLALDVAADRQDAVELDVCWVAALGPG